MLDADSPYQTPSKEELQEKPEPLAYPKSASKYRYYGTNMQTMIDVALSWEEGELKEALIFTIANHMKKCYLNWNKDTVDDAIIFNHLFDLSGGKFDLRDSKEELSEVKELMKKRNTQGQNPTKNLKKQPFTKNRKR